MLAKGYLVARAAGGLEALSVRLENSGRFTDYRQPRPDEEGRQPTINDAESPLAWLRSRKDKSGRPLISVEQFMAGERLRSDYERSCLERRVTASWELPTGRGRGNSGADLTDAALTARQNFNDALDEAPTRTRQHTDPGLLSRCGHRAGGTHSRSAAAEREGRVRSRPHSAGASLWLYEA
jgi:hypothetical protein